ncbi:hypothetical protein HME9302_02213 [Alteripontixanthobacter maritimus]|uniref:PRC-barrel domain-containing protein n=1 Tax=Alteripontixanthobacter maritimus TaxID=2161824 RepID=A0A369QCN4_9SPHN|nr:PRC-barrel domain-containing protein [Alteripontixanthobacter maritimus]RDC60996.1 hypothetical protein HME9302_02213 [Alteripontixanthobacter maritimus]
MKHDQRFETLEAAGDWKVEHGEQDIRGRPLVSPNGHTYGTIDELLIDKDEKRVIAIRLDDGRLASVEPLEIHDDKVVYGEAAETYAARHNVTGEVSETYYVRYPRSRTS